MLRCAGQKRQSRYRFLYVMLKDVKEITCNKNINREGFRKEKGGEVREKEGGGQSLL